MAELRAEFSKGGLEATLLAAQLLEMVDKLQVQLRSAEALATAARREVAAHEAAALERQLERSSPDGGCPTCHDASARATLERLRAIAAGADVDPDPRSRSR